MTYDVYVHINKINGKVYVGMEKRWRNHIKRAKHDDKYDKAIYFHRAILKHGVDAWEHKLLEISEILEEAEIAEKKWIAQCQSTDKQILK